MVPRSTFTYTTGGTDLVLKAFKALCNEKRRMK
jgi:hypothetical protein